MDIQLRISTRDFYGKPRYDLATYVNNVFITATSMDNPKLIQLFRHGKKWYVQIAEGDTTLGIFCDKVVKV